jgi:hypothetical protein
VTVVRTSVTILAASVAMLSGVSVETAAGDPAATLAGMSPDEQVGEVFMVGGPARPGHGRGPRHGVSRPRPARRLGHPDRNLVAYRSDGTAAWASGTWREGPSRPAVQDDGNVVLYRSDGTASWYTGWDTGGGATSPGNGTFVPRP